MLGTIDTSLTRSIATQSLADVLGTVSETAIDAALESGPLRDIPIIGTIVGVMKTGRDIQSALFIRKVAFFLKTLSETSDEDRNRFIGEFDTPQKQHKFGEAILLLLERAEDMEKPKLIARIINAHICGNIDQNVAFRICAVIDRCYVNDLDLLKNFVNGTQRKNTPIAESLASVGFLSNGGFDGGVIGEEDSGGVIYSLNKYGKIFVKYVLQSG